MEELLKNYWVVDGDETAWATPQNARNTLEKKKPFFAVILKLSSLLDKLTPC